MDTQKPTTGPPRDRQPLITECPHCGRRYTSAPAAFVYLVETLLDRFTPPRWARPILVGIAIIYVLPFMLDKWLRDVTSLVKFIWG